MNEVVRVPEEFDDVELAAVLQPPACQRHAVHVMDVVVDRAAVILVDERNTTIVANAGSDGLPEVVEPHRWDVPRARRPDGAMGLR